MDVSPPKTIPPMSSPKIQKSSPKIQQMESPSNVGLVDGKSMILEYDLSSSQNISKVAETGRDEFGFLPSNQQFSNFEQGYISNRESLMKSGTPNFTKNIKWSPDGSCILSNSEDNMIRLFEIPSSLYNINNETVNSLSKIKDTLKLEPTFKISGAQIVYDFDWYPYMNSNDPSTCCFLSSSGNKPVHLYDAYTGTLRASYTCLNQFCEYTSAYSVAFNCMGNRIYCGLNKEIRVFDVSMPSKKPSVVKCTDKSKEGQNGIISCLAFNPVMPNLYAAGCYNKSIGLYEEDGNSILMLLVGHSGGVTQVKFSPNGWYMFSGARKDSSICCWDIRMNTPQPLYTCERKVTTNQKVTFDIDITSRYLITGSEGGEFIIFDLYQNGKELLRYKATLRDCINSAAFHPSLPLITTSSGERLSGIMSIKSLDERIDEMQTLGLDTLSDIPTISIFHIKSDYVAY